LLLQELLDGIGKGRLGRLGEAEPKLHSLRRVWVEVETRVLELFHEPLRPDSRRAGLGLFDGTHARALII